MSHHTFDAIIVTSTGKRLGRLLECSEALSSIRVLSGHIIKNSVPVEDLETIIVDLDDEKCLCLNVASSSEPLNFIFASNSVASQFCEAVLCMNINVRKIRRKVNIAKWIPDSEARQCMRCSTGFSLTRRKHHCRTCGYVVCSSCSKNRAYVATSHLDNTSGGRVSSTDRSDLKPWRVCDECFVQIRDSRMDGYGIQGARSRDNTKAEAAQPDSIETDEYGFVIQTPTSAKSKKEAVAKREELRRVWNSYLAKYPNYENPKLLKKLIRRGIPPELRGAVWGYVSGASEMQAIAKKTYYQDLLEKAKSPQWRDSESISQIEKDLKRTLPNNVHFQDMGSSSIAMLNRILVAYSVHNPAVGYCQSLNFIAGYLLLFTDEIPAFWLLATVVENICCVLGEPSDGDKGSNEEVEPAFYYQRDLAGVRIDQGVFGALLAKKLPDVNRKLKKLTIPIEPLTVKWFLSLYVNTLPAQTVLRIWDCMFNEGIKVIFRAGLALLKINQKSILKSSDMSDLMEKLQAFSSSVDSNLDADQFMNLCFDSMWLGSFPMSRISWLRQCYKATVDSEPRFEQKKDPKPIRDMNRNSVRFIDSSALKVALIGDIPADDAETNDEKEGSATGSTDMPAGGALDEEKSERDAAEIASMEALAKQMQSLLVVSQRMNVERSRETSTVSAPRASVGSSIGAASPTEPEPSSASPTPSAAAVGSSSPLEEVEEVVETVPAAMKVIEAPQAPAAAQTWHDWDNIDLSSRDRSRTVAYAVPKAMDSVAPLAFVIDAVAPGRSRAVSAPRVAASSGSTTEASGVKLEDILELKESVRKPEPKEAGDHSDPTTTTPSASSALGEDLHGAPSHAHHNRNVTGSSLAFSMILEDDSSDDDSEMSSDGEENHEIDEEFMAHNRHSVSFLSKTEATGRGRGTSLTVDEVKPSADTAPVDENMLASNSSEPHVSQAATQAAFWPSQDPSSSKAPDSDLALDPKFAHRHENLVKSVAALNPVDSYRTCPHCQESVPETDSSVFALGSVWHPHHFQCSTCSCSLTNSSFYNKDGKVYCEKDYKEQFMPKCGKCGEYVMSGVSSKSGDFHRECVSCSVCQCASSEEKPFYQTEAGDFLCDEHYRTTMLSTCVVCQDVIDLNVDVGMRVFEREYHERCLKCTVCTSLLSEASKSGVKVFSSKVFDGALFCSSHESETSCASCLEPLALEAGRTGAEPVTFEDKASFHRACAKCVTCGLTYDESGGSLTEHLLRIYCKDHKPSPPSAHSSSSSGIATDPSPAASVDQCYGCRKRLDGAVLSLQGRSYHADCLKCITCGSVFVGGKGIYPHANDFFCKPCYTLSFCASCSSCEKPIVEGQTIKIPAGDDSVLSFHKDCFLCSECHSPFPDNRYFLLPTKKPCCQACVEKL